MTLTGADTILAQQAALANAPRPGPAKDGPLILGADAARRWHGTAPPADLVPISSEQLDGELTWLRYRLRR